MYYVKTARTQLRAIIGNGSLAQSRSRVLLKHEQPAQAALPVAARRDVPSYKIRAALYLLRLRIALPFF